MNSGKHHFFVTAFDEFPHLPNDKLRVHASPSAANGRNDAERAVCIAAVLNLHNRACSSCGAGVNGSAKFSLLKNVAAEDFGSTGGNKILVVQGPHGQLRHDRFMG